MEKEFKFFVERIEGTNIISEIVRGEVTDDVADSIYEQNKEMVESLDDPNDARMLVDLREGRKVWPKGRKQFTSVLKEGKVKKVAIPGNKPFLRTMLTFNRIVSGVDNVRNFSSKNDAVAWLND